jgi:hexokinase
MKMKNKITALSNERMEAIAKDLQVKIYNGLSKSGEEIACLPTYINPGKDFAGKVLALDWGGTNFRASVILFEKGKKPKVLETLKKTLSSKEAKGFTGEDLCESMTDLIAQLKNLDETVTQIGYCFSYPAESTLDGDAILLRWTKGIDIPDMIDKLVGKPLMDYINNYKSIKERKIEFKDIKVINDTIACLFAGLEQPGFDSYIGLIVGTGTNMAAVIHKSEIVKLSEKYNGGEWIPVNLESGI